MLKLSTKQKSTQYSLTLPTTQPAAIKNVYFFSFSCDRLVFFCVPLTLFWLLVLVKDHHLEVSHHLFDISGKEHMAIQRQSPMWHHRPQGKVEIVKTPDWGLWTLPDCLHPSVLSKKCANVGLCFWCMLWFLKNCVLSLLHSRALRGLFQNIFSIILK